MFNLMLFLDISDGRPGMMVPLFSSPSTNIPYVQQMDEFLQVRAAIPFLEYENYPVILADTKRTIAVGDNGLVAFRSYDGALVSGDFNEILEYIEANSEPLSRNPILRSQLNRITATELTPSYDVWRSVAEGVFAVEGQRKLWLDSELQIFQKQKRIWTEIDAADFEERRPTEAGLGAPISEFSTEYLIQWLGVRGNYLSRDWTSTWHYVNERVLFDDRLVQIALNWMFFLGAENQDLHQIKSILLALLEFEARSKVDLSGLGEFLSDLLSTDPSLVFSFLRPQRFFAMFASFLARNGEMEYVLRFVAFAANELPKEKYIVAALKSALATIMAQTKKTEDYWVPSTHNRDFEQKQVEFAQALELQLERYSAD